MRNKKLIVILLCIVFCCSVLLAACNIAAKPLDQSMITLESETVVYNGSAQTPAVTVTDAGVAVSSSEYSVAYSNNTNVGTATVTVSAKVGSRVISGSATKTFDITKANQATLSINSVGAKKYGDAPFTLSTSGGSGTGAVSFSVVSGPAAINATTLTITGVGDVIVKAIKAADANYNEAVSAPYNITIDKKMVAKPQATTGLTYNGAVQIGVEEGEGSQ